MKASELIQGAVEDARSLDRKIYFPNSSRWHVPGDSEDSECYICFAGAWIAKRFHHGQWITLGDLNQKEKNLCMFLDDIRRGNFDFIGKYATLAGLEHPVETEAALRHIHDPDPERNLMNPAPPATVHFWGWDQFDRFLRYAETLAGLLKKMGC